MWSKYFSCVSLSWICSAFECAPLVDFGRETTEHRAASGDFCVSGTLAVSGRARDWLVSLLHPLTHGPFWAGLPEEGDGSVRTPLPPPDIVVMCSWPQTCDKLRTNRVAIYLRSSVSFGLCWNKICSLTGWFTFLLFRESSLTKVKQLFSWLVQNTLN